jgi:PAS domain-containing protein
MPRVRSKKAARIPDDEICVAERVVHSPTVDADTLARVRAEADAAIVHAQQAHARLLDAIEILPHGLVFLDADGRYILWNQQYSDIYSRSADLFKPGARLADLRRVPPRQLAVGS